MPKLSKLLSYLLGFHLMLWGDDPGGGGGPTPTPAPTPAPPESFSREYVTELRNESKGYRLKAQEQEQRAKAAEEKAAAAEAAANAKAEEATKAANDRILRAELKAAAIKAGMVDLDGLKLADLSSVKLNDAGEVEGAEALMEQLKKDKPYLFGNTGTTTHTGDPPKPKTGDPVDVRTMKPEEYAAHKRAMLGKK